MIAAASLEEHPATTTIASGGVYSATGSLTSSEVIDNGTITPGDGALTIDGSVDGTGVIDVGSGDKLTLTSAFNAKAGDMLTISLTGPVATMDLKDLAGFAADINRYATGDEVEVYGIAGQPAPTYSYASGDTIATYANGITLTFGGAYAAGSVQLAAGTVPPPTLPCFLIGTHIATQRGEILVEDFARGATAC